MIGIKPFWYENLKKKTKNWYLAYNFIPHIQNTQPKKKYHFLFPIFWDSRSVKMDDVSISTMKRIHLDTFTLYNWKSNDKSDSCQTNRWYVEIKVISLLHFCFHFYSPANHRTSTKTRSFSIEFVSDVIDFRFTIVGFGSLTFEYNNDDDRLQWKTNIVFKISKRGKKNTMKFRSLYPSTIESPENPGILWDFRTTNIESTTTTTITDNPIPSQAGK